jgi:hypothetical protein
MTAGSWRSRIVGHGAEAPDQLLANPANWRIHPKHQQDALAGVLDQVGWVQDVIVNQQTGHVIDGHLRVSLAISRQEPAVPVVYVDLDDDEERLILATLDPLAAMAATDNEALANLLATIKVEDENVARLVSFMAEQHVPSVPVPTEQREPTLASECLIEIRCSLSDRDDFAATLALWETRDGVTIDIS